VSGSALPGVRLGRLVRHGDSRGAFREVWRASAFPALTVRETGAPAGSTPPAWGVLAPTPLPGGEPPRTWQAALADYAPTLLRGATR